MGTQAPHRVGGDSEGGAVGSTFGRLLPQAVGAAEDALQLLPARLHLHALQLPGGAADASPTVPIDPKVTPMSPIDPSVPH